MQRKLKIKITTTTIYSDNGPFSHFWVSRTVNGREPQVFLLCFFFAFQFAQITKEKLHDGVFTTFKKGKKMRETAVRSETDVKCEPGPILSHTGIFVAISKQCWGKLLLKVMHYNITFLPKKVTNCVT